MSNDISLYRAEDMLVIQIDAVLRNEEPTATIISFTGETIEKFYLKKGINTIDAGKYSGKKYSIRIKTVTM